MWVMSNPLLVREVFFFKTYCYYQQDAPSRTKGPLDVISRSQESILGYKSNYPTESDDMRT